jgi:NAD(P)-dependent dehydrogenase (short-subunit alcohol dehydrogenase family)
MTSGFRRKCFIITGASKGIGAELALQLADYGHRLVLAARDEQALQDIAGQCRRDGTTAIVMPTDVTVEGDCRRLVDRALEAFGRIDVLVNNAGASMQARFDDISDWTVYERLWRVNCLGTIHCTRFAWPHLKANPGRRGGQIVGINSLAGRTGARGRTGYCASQFAQAGFLDALRTEAAEHGITVTVVYPDWATIETRRRGANGNAVPVGDAGPEESGKIALDEFARQIVSAIEDRSHELVVPPATGRLGRWLTHVVPGWGSKRGQNGVQKEEAQ